MSERQRSWTDPPDDEPLADPARLFEEEGLKSTKPRPNPQPWNASPGDGYDVVGGDEAADEPVPPPVPQPTTRRSPTERVHRTETTGRVGSQRKPDGSKLLDDDVEEVWSRFSEWGKTLRILAIGGGVWLVLLYLTFSIDHLGRTLLIFALGAAALVVLSYPIAITIERPVRTVPEQAVRDYFDALSHHLPHYKRMWLILSNRGKKSRLYSNEEAFKSYWLDTLARLRPSELSKWTPLDFKLEDFKSEKSAGKTTIEGSFRVDVYVRGSASSPIASFAKSVGFVKGSDGMWYLGDGTLPEDRDLKRSAKRPTLEE